MNSEFQATINQIASSSDIFEKSRLIVHLRKDKKVSLKDISSSLGIKPSYVSHIMRLSRLPEMIVDGYTSELVSLSHLFLISRLKLEADMTALYEQILVQNLTVAKTEEYVRKYLYKIDTVGEYYNKQKSENVDIEELSKLYAGATFEIVQTRVRGRVHIVINGNLETSSKIIQQVVAALRKG